MHKNHQTSSFLTLIDLGRITETEKDTYLESVKTFWRKCCAYVCARSMPSDLSFLFLKSVLHLGYYLSQGGKNDFFSFRFFFLAFLLFFSNCFFSPFIIGINTNVCNRLKGLLVLYCWGLRDDMRLYHFSFFWRIFVLFLSLL